MRDYYWTALEAFHAYALIKLGMAEEAAELYAELKDWSGTIAGLTSTSVVFGPMDDLLAGLAELCGDADAAARHREISATVMADVRRQLAEIG